MYEGPIFAAAFYLWILVLHLHKSSFSVGLVYLDVHECATSPFRAQRPWGLFSHPGDVVIAESGRLIS